MHPPAGARALTPMPLPAPDYCFEFSSRAPSPNQSDRRRGHIHKLEIRQPAIQFLFRPLQSHLALELSGRRQTLQHRLTSIEVAGVDVGQEVVRIFLRAFLSQRIWAEAEVVTGSSL